MSITLIQEIGISERLRGAKMSAARKKMFQRMWLQSIAGRIGRFIRRPPLNLYNYVLGADSSWFSDSLGSNCAVVRAGTGRGRLGDARSRWQLAGLAGIDLAAITVLYKARTSELEILQDRLLTKAVAHAPLCR